MPNDNEIMFFGLLADDREELVIHGNQGTQSTILF